MSDADLPRETVRRKLEALRELGRVERNSRGSWQVAAAGLDAQTRGHIADTARRLLGVAAQLSFILHHVQQSQQQ